MVEVVFRSDARQKALDAIMKMADGRLVGSSNLYVDEIVTKDFNGDTIGVFTARITQSGKSLNFNDDPPINEKTDFACYGYFIETAEQASERDEVRARISSTYGGLKN